MSRVSRCERHIAFLYLNASEWQIMSGTLNFSVIHVRTRNHVPIAYKYIVFFSSEALCYEFSSFQWVAWPKSLTLLRFEVAGSENSCFNWVVSDIWDFPIISKNFLLHGSCRKAYMDAARCCSHWRFGSVSAFWNHPDPWRPTESGFSRAGARFTFMSFLQKSDGRKKHWILLPWKKCYVYIFYIICRETFFFAHHVSLDWWSNGPSTPAGQVLEASPPAISSCGVAKCPAVKRIRQRRIPWWDWSEISMEKWNQILILAGKMREKNFQSHIDR